MIEPSFLLSAYASGYFPMADSKTAEIGWYSPDPRAIIPLNALNISRSLDQVIRKHTYELRVDEAFEKVIRSCGKRKETWISEEIVQSYCELHRLGHAHSIEAWKDNSLAGGLYGVALGGAFFGESMFSVLHDSSKVALVALVERLKTKKFRLLDTQFITPHLARFGAIEISRDDYLKLLSLAVRDQCSF